MQNTATTLTQHTSAKTPGFSLQAPAMLEKNLLTDEIDWCMSNTVQHYTAGGIKADFIPAPK